MRFCRFVEISTGGGSTRQPQSKEPCQCVNGQPWACHGALQGQMQPLRCAAGVVEPSVGAAAGLGRWFVGVAVLPVYWFVEISKGGGSTRQLQRTEPCQCVSGQPWAYDGALQGQMQPLLCAAGVVGPALGAVAGLLGRWFVEVAVLTFCGDFQRRGQHSATMAHTALPVWVAGHPWACHGALQGQMQPLLCAAGLVRPALGAAAGVSSVQCFNLSSAVLSTISD